MRAHPRLDNAVVVPCPADDGIAELAGFFTGESISDQELRDFLADRLPTYMAPRCLVRLERLPLNRNGKIDRRTLTNQAAALVDAKSSASGWPVPVSMSFAPRPPLPRKDHLSTPAAGK